MMISQTHESPLRLENLGHVSGYYGSLPTMRQWSPDFIDESHFCSMNSFPDKKPYVIQNININTSELIPAKNLHQNRHSDILSPGEIPRRPISEYYEASAWPRHPEALTPGPKQSILYAGYFPRQSLKPSHTSRPVTLYSAYRPPEAKRARDHIICNSISLCESPSIYTEDHYGQSNCNNATCSCTPSPPTDSPKQGLSREWSFLETNIARASQLRHSIASSTPASVPAPIRRPPPTSKSVPSSFPSPSSSRSRFSTCSTRSTQSGNPGYGAWSPTPLRSKHLSFKDRARARLHQRLVSIGWRTPSFKVHNVVKVTSPNPAVSSPLTEPSQAERTHEVNQKVPCATCGLGITNRQSVISTPSPCTLERPSLHLDTSSTPQGITELEAPPRPPQSGNRANRPLSGQFSDDSLKPQSRSSITFGQFDDRRNLPSQIQQQDATKQPTLSRKRCVRLR